MASHPAGTTLAVPEYPPLLLAVQELLMLTAVIG